MLIGLVTTPGKRYEDIKWTGSTFDSIRASCFDGKARLADMDFDGVDAGFLYPSQRTMFYFMGNDDRDFHRAGVRAYNDWISEEFCANDPERLFGLAQMPNLGVDEMIAEMERCKKKGFRGVVISTWPSGEDDLLADDDRFFAAAVDMNMPVSIHVNIQRKRNPKLSVEGPAAIGNMALCGMLSFPPIMCELIMSGLFDRFPTLKIVGVETEIGWVPEALEQLDNFYWLQIERASRTVTTWASAIWRGLRIFRTTAAIGPTAASTSPRCSKVFPVTRDTIFVPAT
jgi:predicted TIM-barrel fold metal-dependent hydrolase